LARPLTRLFLEWLDEKHDIQKDFEMAKKKNNVFGSKSYRKIKK